jgi:subtilisin-like proprotein convertase family protein
MKRICMTIVMVAMVALPLASARAQPSTMTLQGVLTTANGDLADGLYAMIFSFYDSADAAEAVLSIPEVDVEVSSGLYNVVLDFGQNNPAGTHEALWLGVTVADADEFPRVPLTSVFYATRAHIAGTAKALACTGCISASMLDFDPVTPDELAVGDLTVDGTVSATAFEGDGSGLTGIVIPSGDCVDGWFVSGIDDAGGLTCEEVPVTIDSVDGLNGGVIDGDVDISGMLTVIDQEVCHLGGNCGDTLWQLGCEEGQAAVYNGDMWACADGVTEIKPEDLPPDGLNEVSNELLTNQFTDTFASQTVPVKIKDFYPPGVPDSIVVDDVGIAQALTVSVNITTSDLSNLEVILSDPEGTEYILYQKNGPGQELGTTYPDPTLPISGDLTTWVGKNPKGFWILRVVDSGFNDIEFDGQINSWSVQVQTMSTKKVQVNGDLVVTGNITSDGGEGITIDDSGNVAVSGNMTIGGNLQGVNFKLDCTIVQETTSGSSVTATCAAGYQVTGGGCHCTPGPNGTMYSSYPNGNGWYCQENNSNVYAYAVCCRILPNESN